MSKIRVLKRPDGSVGVIHPIPKSRKENETEEQWLDRVFVKANPLGLPYADMDSSELPATREDRNVWELVGNKVKINQAKKQQLDDEKQAKKAIKDSAVTKLKALNLTEEEIESLKNG